MIGAVLHLWQRAVDRLGDALEGPEMTNLRVTLAALSARVAAAEGAAARLRDERDHAVGWSQGMTEAAAEMETSLIAMTVERDAALDEVERLRGELATAHRACGHALKVEAAATAEAARERDEARDTVIELSYKLDAAGHEWFETEKERDEARADLEALRAAVRRLNAGRCSLRAVLDLLPEVTP